MVNKTTGGDDDNSQKVAPCTLFTLPQLKIGQHWLHKQSLEQKFCSSLKDAEQVKSMDEFVLADDYDTNYSHLLSLARTIQPESKHALTCYLYQLDDWMCK